MELDKGTLLFIVAIVITGVLVGLGKVPYDYLLTVIAAMVAWLGGIEVGKRQAQKALKSAEDVSGGLFFVVLVAGFGLALLGLLGIMAGGFGSPIIYSVLALIVGVVLAAVALDYLYG